MTEQAIFAKEHNCHYKCVGCECEWRMPLVTNIGGHVANPARECPNCGSVYFTWINYETDFKK